MAERVTVDTGGLGSGAARSAVIAVELAQGAVADSGSGSQPSHAGVSALNTAISSLRGRQSARVAKHASSMRTGADLYDATDTQSAQNLAETL
jgi:hypothetical protein